MKEDMVSIITPMYKGAAFVGDAIRSVMAQDYQNWEMIIVDDCSPDGGAGIAEVRKVAGGDPRVILVESKQNRGSSGARNIALEKAQGRYIAFLDSDDIWHDGFLTKQLNFMKQKDAALVFTSYRRIDEDTKEELLRPFVVPDKVTYKSLLKTNPIAPSTAIIDTAKTPKSYFDEKLGSMRDDYVYLLHLLKKIGVAYGNKEVLADYRMRKASATGDKRKVIKPQWNVLYHEEKIGLLPSIYNMICWAWISYNKYRK